MEGLNMINVAIIGTGNIAPQHIKGLMEFKERCRIIALCDIYPQKAEDMKERFGLECKVYKYYHEMLEDLPEINLVHICTPPYTHAQIAIDVMKQKKNVVVEKPMASSVSECQVMLQTQKENQVTLSCIAQNRFRNPVYKLKKVLDSNLAGKICCAHINSYWWRGHSYYDLWWRGTWEKEGGGPTLNHAVHHIDMLNWLEEKMPVQIGAMLTNVMHDNSEVEDLSLAMLMYENQSVAQITSSVIHHGEEQGITLQCEHARISVPWSVKAEISAPNGFPCSDGNKELIEQIEKFYQSIPDLKYEGHTGQIDNVLTAIETNTSPMITGEDGMKTVALISAIYKAGATHQMIDFPLDSVDDFNTVEGIQRNVPYFHEKSKSVENFEDNTITLGNYDR